MGKSAKSVSITGGADGPTSVFIVGRTKEKNIVKRIKTEYLNRKYRKRRRAAEKKIVPCAHTMEETIRYMKEYYGAVEADASCRNYNERRRDMKLSLIQRKKPELLGGEKKFDPPDDLSDQQAVSEWMRQVDEWMEECRKRADEISNEIFPTDYHMFIIDKGEQGKLEIEADTVSSVFGVSYAGDKKIMEPVLRDIYLFYGVTGEDIEKRSDRYRSLLAVLSN